MATDQAAKKSALEARLKTLDADSERVAAKRKATQEQLANLGKKAEPKAERPTRAKKA